MMVELRQNGGGWGMMMSKLLYAMAPDSDVTRSATVAVTFAAAAAPQPACSPAPPHPRVTVAATDDPGRVTATAIPGPALESESEPALASQPTISARGGAHSPTAV